MNFVDNTSAFSNAPESSALLTKTVTLINNCEDLRGLAGNNMITWEEELRAAEKHNPFFVTIETNEKGYKLSVGYKPYEYFTERTGPKFDEGKLRLYSFPYYEVAILIEPSAPKNSGNLDTTSSFHENVQIDYREHVSRDVFNTLASKRYLIESLFDDLDKMSIANLLKDDSNESGNQLKNAIDDFGNEFSDILFTQKIIE